VHSPLRGAISQIAVATFAEQCRARPSAAESHAYFATRRAIVRLFGRGTCRELFPLFRTSTSWLSALRFARVYAYRSRLNEWQRVGVAFVGCQSIFRKKSETCYTPRTHVRLCCTITLAVLPDSGAGVLDEEARAWSASGAPVSTCHKPLPQPRSQRGKCTRLHFSWSE